MLRCISSLASFGMLAIPQVPTLHHRLNQRRIIIFMIPLFLKEQKGVCESGHYRENERISIDRPATWHHLVVACLSWSNGTPRNFGVVTIFILQLLPPCCIRAFFGFMLKFKQKWSPGVKIPRPRPRPRSSNQVSPVRVVRVLTSTLEFAILDLSTHSLA